MKAYLYTPKEWEWTSLVKSLPYAFRKRSGLGLVNKLPALSMKRILMGPNTLRNQKAIDVPRRKGQYELCWYSDPYTRPCK
jgi:hypothetical protein